MKDRFRYPKKVKDLFRTTSQLASRHEVNGVAVLRAVATELYESLSTPISLSCEIMLRYGDIAQLVRKTVSPSSYNDSKKFCDDYQAVNFLRKVPFQVEGLDAEAEAKRKFLEAEAKCKETNLRIRHFLENPERASVTIRRAFSLSGMMVQEVLGTAVGSAEWLNSCRFGPGSFTHPDARGLTSIYDKLQVTPSVTPDFRDMGAILVMSSPSWARSILDIEDEGFWPFVKDTDLTVIPGNRVMFVPKTATTERAIAVEPLVNIYAQLGIGAMMRKRLLHVAEIDLSEQWFNQELAREGSRRGILSTIDLSSASDTVAREVVRALLPEAWYHAMNVCRSKIGMLDGKSFVYEKFSSMGNGFTFELETLLFWSFARAACVIANVPEMVSVYGDDIIVPVEAYETLEEILHFFGFELNSKKSFKEGPFRESCGKDYYDGEDVRPFLQTEVPKELSELYSLANGIRRLAHRRAGSLYGCSMRYERAWIAVVRALPRPLRAVGVPAHAGDTDGLVVDWDVAQRSPFVVSSWNGWEGFMGLRLAPVPLDTPRCYHFEGGVASLLYRARNGFEEDFVPAPPRQGRDISFELRYGAFWGPWTDLGPWIDS